MRHPWAVAMVLGLAATAGGGRAAEHAAVGPYLADDVAAVAYVDLQKIDLPALVEELARLEFVMPRELEEVRQAARTFQETFAQLPARGARRAYVLLRPVDVLDGGPLWLIETEKPEQSTAIVEWLRPLLKQAESLGDAAAYLPNEVNARGSMVVAGHADRLKRLATTDLPVRGDAVAALAALDADAGVVVFGNADSRRVLREMFPQLPAPFMEIDGRLLADGVRWGAVNVKLPPAPVISLAVEAADEPATTTLRQALDKATELAKAYLLHDSVSGLPAHRQRAQALLPLMPLVKPQVEGNRLMLTFGDDAEEVAFVANLLPALTQELRGEASVSERINHFKQIVLGLLNHESARGRFPAAASYDPQGKPLLSWRVHILPYMERMDLYKQFKLDEPWDSEHNRPLIERMPEVYADPDPAVRAAIGAAGRTTYVVPRGEGLIFERPEGMKFNDLKDGSSNTMVVVEVVPERAVVWTKPDDWEVDLNDPLRGVKRDDREGFVAAYADGSVRVLGNDNAPELIKALLTPAGGEVIDHSQVK